MWHIDGELIALLFLLALMVDIFQTSSVSGIRDKLFRLLAIVTAVAIFVDIVSSGLMMNFSPSNLLLLHISLMLYFLITPILSMLWYFYSLAVIEKPREILKKQIILYTLLYGIFGIFVITTSFHGLFYQLAADGAYARGKYFNVLFLIFYGFNTLTMVLAVLNYKKLERTTFVILTIFPLIAGMGIFLQQKLPGYLITGTAFTLVLFITYLFLQNRKITRDVLTGLYNRQAFLNAIDRLSRNGSNGFMLSIDIDDFKFFNQTFGQKKGDLLLQQVGRYLLNVSDNKTCYRYGGDVFILVLSDYTESQVISTCNQIKGYFENSIYIKDIGYKVSVSMGVVEYPHSNQGEHNALITAIDFSMVQAKKQGRGQVAFFNTDLVLRLRRKHDVMEAVNDALENELFMVYFQPIYNMEKKRFLFAESLLRMKDEKLGFISPAEFIPIAEEGGKIIEITYFVLRKVCKFLKDNEEILEPSVSISVNLSVVHFMQHDMVEQILAIIQEYGISPDKIKMEITESILIDSFEDIQVSMNKLSDLGIVFALDDYGQGYSNISYLINLPIRYVKLDKSIIDNIETDSNVIRALVPMFQSLDKILVAEGVETKGQADILDSLRCHCIQGYYFAKPMPMEQALPLLSKDDV